MTREELATMWLKATIRWCDDDNAYADCRLGKAFETFLLSLKRSKRMRTTDPANKPNGEARKQLGRHDSLVRGVFGATVVRGGAACFRMADRRTAKLMQWNALTRQFVGVKAEEVTLAEGIYLPPTEWVRIYDGGMFGPYAVYEEDGGDREEDDNDAGDMHSVRKAQDGAECSGIEARRSPMRPLRRSDGKSKADLVRHVHGTGRTGRTPHRAQTGGHVSRGSRIG